MILSRADFLQTVATAMELPVEELASLSFEEMGLDSIQLYELDVTVEALGALVPEAVLASMERIDDVYQAYVIELSTNGDSLMGPTTL